MEMSYIQTQRVYIYSTIGAGEVNKNINVIIFSFVFPVFILSAGFFSLAIFVVVVVDLIKIICNHMLRMNLFICGTTL